MSLDELQLTRLIPKKLQIPKEIPSHDDPSEYTEVERMLIGLPYKAFGDDFMSGNAYAKVLCRRLNKADPLDLEIRKEIIGELFGTAGDAYIEPPFLCNYGSNVHVGTNVFINRNCFFLDICKISIGDNVKFGPGVQVLTATHPLDPIERRITEFGKPIKIGNDCFLGASSIILPGVTIGDGVTVGAGSVVNRDIPSFCVVAGTPAKIIENYKNL